MKVAVQLGAKRLEAHYGLLSIAQGMRQLLGQRISPRSFR